MPVTCCERPSGTVRNPCSRPKAAPGQGRDRDAGPEIAPRIDGDPAGEGAGDHDALDAEVEHAGALADQLAEGGEDQRRGDAHGGDPEAGGEQDLQRFQHQRHRIR